MDEQSPDSAPHDVRRFQFSLAALLAAVVVAASLLWLAQQVGAGYAAAAIDLMILALAAAVYYRPTRTRLPVAIGLAATHTLLIAVAAAIEFGVGIDDMSPSLLRFMALYYLDLPIIVTLEGLGMEHLSLNLDGSFALLTLLGGLFWFAVGAIVQVVVAVAIKLRTGTG